MFIEGNIFFLYLLHVKWSNFLNTYQNYAFRVVTTWMENSVWNFMKIGWELTEKSAKFIHHG